MHRVSSTIRRIAPADLPSTDPQVLLNLGIVHLHDTLYECREQENNHHSTPDAPMVPVVAIPGAVLSEGPVQPRHDRLPASVKVDLWRAKVRVAKGKDKRVEIVEKDAATIEPTDDVVEAGIKKHRWSGESER